MDITINFTFRKDQSVKHFNNPMLSLSKMILIPTSLPFSKFCRRTDRAARNRVIGVAERTHPLMVAGLTLDWMLACSFVLKGAGQRRRCRTYDISVTLRKDGRWMVTYRAEGKTRWEYFGKGLPGEKKAREMDQELKVDGVINAYVRRPEHMTAPVFGTLANEYLPKISIRNRCGNLNPGSCRNSGTSRPCGSIRN